MQPIDPYPPFRYEIYKKKDSDNWLGGLHHWQSKTRAEIRWSEDFGRGKNNVAEHTMTPVCKYSLYYY